MIRCVDGQCSKKEKKEINCKHLIVQKTDIYIILFEKVTIYTHTYTGKKATCHRKLQHIY